MDTMKSSENKAFLFVAQVENDAAMVRMGGKGDEVLGLLASLNEGVARTMMNHGAKACDAVALLQIAVEEGARRALSGRGGQEQWQ